VCCWWVVAGEEGNAATPIHGGSDNSVPVHRRGDGVSVHQRQPPECAWLGPFGRRGEILFPAVAGRVAGVAAGRRGSRSGSWAATPSGAIATVAVVWVPQIFTKNVKPLLFGLVNLTCAEVATTAPVVTPANSAVAGGRGVVVAVPLPVVLVPTPTVRLDHFQPVGDKGLEDDLTDLQSARRLDRRGVTSSDPAVDHAQAGRLLLLLVKMIVVVPVPVLFIHTG